VTSGSKRCCISDTKVADPERLCHCSVQEIDAYWLQRRIAKAFGDQSDPNAVQEQAEKVGPASMAVTHAHVGHTCCGN
jgi:Tfp pilus assembly protein PilF